MPPDPRVLKGLVGHGGRARAGFRYTIPAWVEQLGVAVGHTTGFFGDCSGLDC